MEDKGMSIQAVGGGGGMWIGTVYLRGESSQMGRHPRTSHGAHTHVDPPLPLQA